MLAGSHIAVAAMTLDKIQDKLDWKINRKAYLIGSVIPDLNCIFPSHAIKSTFKKFQKHILRVEKSQPGFIRSFTLGMVMHYTCDYFCFVHNINSHGPLHTVYEVHLHNHIKNQIHSVEDIQGINKDLLDQIDSQWSDVEQHLMENINCENNAVETMNNFAEKGIDHLESLTSLILNMNEQYIKDVDINLNKGWAKGFNRTDIDIAYAISMCTKVAMKIA